MSITRTYDFAGEAIRVTKTVDLGSEEAKNVKRDEGVKKNETTSLLKPVGISGWEKSKLDWETFKDQEGIEDELRNFNKDGYLEKQAFLQRADERQFEIEKDMRKGTRRK
ncbi:Craniofacial development protein 1 [Acropora cervicornis]|uniref:Craniofacial development protein 1 n=1 Tax=Acropora cervicornis TaxID=6130 RepID=A0AAD9V4D6_ACRCE|nr:Craniofacial development protein 1 [Acropora cervicornis]